MSVVPSPEKLFEDISTFITQSRELLEKGAVMELEGLDGEVKRLCEATLNLSKEQRAQYADKLQELLRSLTELGNELTQQRDQLASEIRGLTDYRKAHVAYSNADATDTFGKKKDDHGNG